MYLVVGLGNPEERYFKTRHNFGFMVVDNLASKLRISFKPGKGSYYIAKTKIDEKDLVLIKPTTYMNRSGSAVVQAMNYFKIELENVLVVCDDLDLDIGRLRLRAGGGSGGNNGLESIIMSLGTEKFSRLRLGINSDRRKSDEISFVLSEFSKKEFETVEFVAAHSRDAILYWLENGIEKTMNKFNSLVIEN